MQTTRGALVCVLALIVLATPVAAQAGKVSPTGKYQASVSCGSGVAEVPGPNGENYTNVGVLVYDTAANLISRPVITCGASTTVGGAAAATMHWLIFVFDKAYKQVKQCESDRNPPVAGGRFTCKESGALSVTLTLKPL